jgi:hypothetical protein
LKLFRTKPMRWAAILVAAHLGMFGLWAGAAWAAGRLQATSTGTVLLSTGEWGVVATTNPTTPPHQQLSVSVPAAFGSAYFSLVNTGSIPITQFTITTNGGTACTILCPSVTLAACSVAWNQTLNSCGGTTTTVASVTLNGSAHTTTVSAAGAVPANPAAVLAIRAQMSTLTLTATTVTINTSVTSASPRQIRAAVVNNG